MEARRHPDMLVFSAWKESLQENLSLFSYNIFIQKYDTK